VDRIDLSFSTDKFNRTEVKSYFINACCFGEDLAQWLVDQLANDGIKASGIGQEDWGWYFTVGKYFVGVGGDASGDEPESSNFGHWRLMIQKRRRVLEFLQRKKIEQNDELFSALHTILKREPSFSNIHTE
jgi:hypothetical protein